jgi:hypothetical protein
VRAYKLTFTSDVEAFADPEACHFIPADELAFSGKDYTQRIRREGIGAPVLAELDSPLENARKQFLISEKIFYSLTSVVEYKGSEARLAMKDPLISDRISIAGSNYPLAADLSIGTAALLARNRPQRLGLIRMIRPAKYAYTARLVRLQPYDRNKIPVLMIHGLQDTPATWLLYSTNCGAILKLIGGTSSGFTTIQAVIHFLILRSCCGRSSTG